MPKFENIELPAQSNTGKSARFVSSMEISACLQSMISKLVLNSTWHTTLIAIKRRIAILAVLSLTVIPATGLNW